MGFSSRRRCGPEMQNGNLERNTPQGPEAEDEDEKAKKESDKEEKKEEDDDEGLTRSQFYALLVASFLAGAALFAVIHAVMANRAEKNDAASSGNPAAQEQ